MEDKIISLNERKPLSHPSTQSSFQSIGQSSTKVDHKRITNVFTNHAKKWKPGSVLSCHLKPTMVVLSLILLIAVTSSKGKAASPSRCRYTCRWDQFCDPGSSQCEWCEQVCSDPDQSFQALCNRKCSVYLQRIRNPSGIKESRSSQPTPRAARSRSEPDHPATDWHPHEYGWWTTVIGCVLIAIVAVVAVVGLSARRYRRNVTSPSHPVACPQQSNDFSQVLLESMDVGESLQSSTESEIDVGESPQSSLTVSDENGVTEKGRLVTHPADAIANPVSLCPPYYHTTDSHVH